LKRVAEAGDVDRVDELQVRELRAGVAEAKVGLVWIALGIGTGRNWSRRAAS